MARLLKKKKRSRTDLRKADARDLSARTQRDLALLYRIGLADSKTDEEIREGNNWSVETLELAKKVFYEIEETEVKTLSSKRAFVEYMTRQLGLVRELNDFLIGAKSLNTAAAHVSAIKVKSDIYDKIIDRALELGFLKRERTSMVLEEELDLSDLSNPDLAERVRENFKDLNILMQKKNPMLIEAKTSKIDGDRVPKFKVKRRLKLNRKITRS